jgi:hypothetical protein
MWAKSRVVVRVGDVIDGKYVLRRRIGEGGIGVVFLAHQLMLERTVAIKMLRPELSADSEQAVQLRNEARTACVVRNPHCVAMIDSAALSDGTPYVVMQYVRGRSLARVIAQDDLSVVRAVRLFVQVLAAVGATHGVGIVHGDVTAENFLVELLDGDEHVTMVDFGLAHRDGAPRTMAATPGEIVVSGTPAYLAPELARGEPPSVASDLYAAGVVLYELLTGTKPFGDGPAELAIARHARDCAIPPSQRRPRRDIPDALDRIALRALDKRPGARFPDASTFAREIRDAVFATRIVELRDSIGAALACGDPARIASGYLELAEALGDDREPGAAARELQEGIDILTGGRGPSAADAPVIVKPLVIALAAIHERTGDRRLARDVAADADRFDTLTDEAPEAAAMRAPAAPLDAVPHGMQPPVSDGVRTAVLRSPRAPAAARAASVSRIRR